MHVLAGDHRGSGTQIFDTRVGAGADEHAVDCDVLDLRARREAHVGECALDCFALGGIVVVGRVRHFAVNRDDHLRIRAPGHLRLEPGDFDRKLAIERRVRIAGE